MEPIDFKTKRSYLPPEDVKSGEVVYLRDYMWSDGSKRHLPPGTRGVVKVITKVPNDYQPLFKGLRSPITFTVKWQGCSNLFIHTYDEFLVLPPEEQIDSLTAFGTTVMVQEGGNIENR